MLLPDTEAVAVIGCSRAGTAVGVRIVPVAYKDSSAAAKDLMAGSLQLMFPTTVSGAPHVKSGS